MPYFIGFLRDIKLVVSALPYTKLTYLLRETTICKRECLVFLRERPTPWRNIPSRFPHIALQYMAYRTAKGHVLPRNTCPLGNPLTFSGL